MSEAPEKGDKTEQPTQKRLDDAQQKGQVATSRDVTSFLLLGVGVLLVSPVGAGSLAELIRPLRSLLERPHLMQGEAGALAALLVPLGFAILAPIALPLLAFALAAIFSNLGQHGFVLTLETIQPKLERVSPLAGLKRLFGPKALGELVKNVVKIVILGAAGWLVMAPLAPDLIATLDLSVPAALVEIQGWLLRACGAALAVVAAVALLDLALQRHEHGQQLRMTRQEVKEENKQTDGDPHVKAKIRQLRMERARHRMMAAVPTATVVITNPTHFAVALRYEPGKTAAPEVVAKGADAVAFRIRAVAREHRVPIVENKPLARALFADVELGQAIPRAHFEAVAEVIGFVLRQGGSAPGPG